MSTRRLGVGVAVLGGYLYAVGGSDGTSPLNTGITFIWTINQWLTNSQSSVYSIMWTQDHLCVFLVWFLCFVLTEFVYLSGTKKYRQGNFTAYQVSYPMSAYTVDIDKHELWGLSFL